MSKTVTIPIASRSFLVPIILVTSLFFCWGFSYGLVDVLNKHFQDALHISKTKSTLLQLAYFGAYFLAAVPAALFMAKFGYKKGIIMGLILYATGAFLCYPAAQQYNFNFFLVSFFILASGITCLETAANPYITILGKPETSEFRLNLSQCFNGVGSFIGPIIAANFFFNKQAQNESSDLASVQIVYLVVGIVMVLLAGLFIRTKLPEIKESNLVSDATLDTKPLYKHGNLVNAVIAQFFYVAAQVGVAALFINYCTEADKGITNAKAAYLFSFSLALFTIGRFAGTALMKKIAPNVLLTVYALINIILCAIVWKASGTFTVYTLMAIFFFESIMFPTIFALGVKDLGHHTKKGSSLIVMSIVGGAVVPYIMGMLAEKSTANAYIVPLLCFIVVAWFGWRGYKIRK